MQVRYFFSSWLMLWAGAVSAQAAPIEDGTQLGLEGGLQLVHQNKPFWGLAQQFSPGAQYRPHYTWAEGYLKPSLKLTHHTGAGQAVFGGASILAGYTNRTDLFAQGANGRVQLEDAYVGWRSKVTDTANGYTLSVGAQPYRLGQGLLLANGAGNGFERGAVIFAPRKAWGMTALAKVEAQQWQAEAFYLDANELKSGDTGTKLVGANVVWTPAPGQQIGLAHFRVTDSTAPYPQAPVSITENGRDGLQTTDLHWQYEPTQGPMAGFSATGELALQRNRRVQMQAKGVGMTFGYRFADWPFTPRVSYSARYFSGDDPSTPQRLERFDALFYDGAPPTWSSGGNGSFAFYNSNLAVHRFRVDWVLSPQDYVNVSFWNVRAAQANSPVQYGQAARLNVTGGQVGLVSGFPDRSLSQELYVEYTRVVTPNLYVTTGMAMAVPQAGVKALLPAGSKRWVGVLANMVYRF